MVVAGISGVRQQFHLVRVVLGDGLLRTGLTSELSGRLEQIRPHQGLAGGIIPGSDRGKSSQPGCGRLHKVSQQTMDVGVEGVIERYTVMLHADVCFEEPSQP